MKGLAAARVQYDAALFDIEVRDELIQFEVVGGNGRTYFRNAGRTRRAGGEVSLRTVVGAVELSGTYSYSHFRFVDFQQDTLQFAGHVIPGIPQHQGEASATWRIGGGYLLGEAVAKSRVFVNDANDASAASFAVVNARTGFTAAFGRPWLSPVFAVQNLFDKHYVGSVAVNAAGTPTTAKFYEPAPGRTWMIGVSAATSPW